MPELYVGLMSGTSLDGIDAVVADLADDQAVLLQACHRPFEPGLRDALLCLDNAAGGDELHRAALAANQLAHAYAAAIKALLSQARISARDIAAAGCHGQTVRHRPESGYTIQLVNGALLAELAEMRVVCDFRSRDVAAGGQGAPLVPAFHRARFASGDAHRVIVNIGGIANVTDLLPGAAVTGFDCGPGNVLLDAWIRRHSGLAYDRDGEWAMQGAVDQPLLERFLEHEFFKLAPPKSTGRHMFNVGWVEGMLRGSEAAVDVQATLLELTAVAIARSINRHCHGASEVYVCGGGARNTAMMQRLRALLGGARLDATDALGVQAQWVEALAFAWLACRTVNGEPGNLPEVTGARGPRVLGALYPL